MKRISIFLIMVALIAGTVGCDGDGGGESYALAIASTEGGCVITPGEGIFSYEEGAVVNLVAEANGGYYFVRWTGDVDTVNDAAAIETAITVNDNYSVTANFVPDGAEPIWDWYDLDAIRDNLSGSYILMNDLDSSTPGYTELASPTANEGKGWEAIAGSGPFFDGTFDGQGYEIKDLFINRPDEPGVGLLDYVDEGGVIKNIGVVNTNVTGSWSVGGLVGSNWGGSVNNSYATGSVNGTEYVGGLVGKNSQGIVINSHSSSNVTGERQIGSLVGGNDGTVSNCQARGEVSGVSGVGGLVGSNNEGTVSNSYSSASITSGTRAGGLVGENWGGSVNNSYATGNVSGSTCVGGLVGENYWGGTVSNSYSTANVTGTDTAGGLVGSNQGTVSNSYSTGSITSWARAGGLVGENSGGSVNNSYATGSVSGRGDVGGLVGKNSEGSVSNSYSMGDVAGDFYVGGLVGRSEGGTVTNSFWDTETSGQATSAGGTGKTTAEMQDITTFSGATWDIVAVANPDIRNLSYIWNIVDDETCPFLSWQ